MADDARPYWPHASVTHRNQARGFSPSRKDSLFNVPFQTPSPWDVIDNIINCVKQDGVYVDPLEPPIVETLARIVLVCTRPDLAHRYRNKIKPLEAAITHEAKWTDPAMRERVVASVRETDASLATKISLSK
jgi:hypothetical protein